MITFDEAKRLSNPNAMPKDFPANQADWERLIAEAPGEDRPPTAEEAATWSRDRIFSGGGVAAFVAQRRV